MTGKHQADNKSVPAAFSDAWSGLKSLHNDQEQIYKIQHICLFFCQTCLATVALGMYCRHGRN